MLKKNNENAKKIDYSSLNSILKTGKNLMNIGYFIAIIAIILLATYLVKEWNILKIIKEVLVVISPIFIGLLIAWLFEPLVTKLQNKKIPRIAGCLLIYLIIKHYNLNLIIYDLFIFAHFCVT